LFFLLALLPPPLPPRLFSPPFCHFPCFFNAFFETFFPEELEEELEEEEEESGGETALAAVGFAHNFFFFTFDALFKYNVFGETHVRKDEKEVIFVLMRILGRVEKERMLLEVRTTAARIDDFVGNSNVSLFNW
jgi:hypothetical protein